MEAPEGLWDTQAGVCKKEKSTLPGLPRPEFCCCLRVLPQPRPERNDLFADWFAASGCLCYRLRVETHPSENMATRCLKLGCWSLSNIRGLGQSVSGMGAAPTRGAAVIGLPGPRRSG